MENINFIALATNVARAYEVAKTGNLKLHVFSNSATPGDIRGLLNFYGIENTPVDEADIIMEFCYDPASIGKKMGSESLADIHERITACPPEEYLKNTDLDVSGDALLKMAITRLDLSIQDVDKIRKIAGVIARLSMCDIIRLEHLAEAIHYRSEYNEREVLRNKIANHIMDCSDLSVSKIKSILDNYLYTY